MADGARLVALISGRGSNFRALLDACESGVIPGRFVAVISNRPGAGGLDIARAAGIPVEVIDHCLFDDRACFEIALKAKIDSFSPNLVVLAGFMRMLGGDFVAHFMGRMINIHPSLLPKYPGLNTHQRALVDHEAEHGASVHFVTHGMDQGPVILQGAVPVLPSDDADSLARRVLTEVEHEIFPVAVRWYCEGRIHLRDDAVYMDGKPLTSPRLLERAALKDKIQ